MKTFLLTGVALFTAATLAADPDALQKHADELFRRSTQCYMVIHDDQIIYERYAPGWDRHKPHGTASAAKGIMGGLALMLAMHDGLIGLDDPACRHIPQWKSDPLKSRITIRQLGAHASGLDDSTEKGLSNNSLPGWKGDFWRQERNPFLISRDETPMIFPPGTAFQYSNPGIGMLNYAVTVAIKESGHRDIRTYLWERLIKRMGIPKEEWSVGYGKTFELDGLPLVATWGGGTVSTRAMAAVGRLLANKGSWDGEQLIDAKVVENVLKHSGTPSTCSGGFWLNCDITGNKPWPSLPQDTAMAAGAKDQVMLFSAAHKLVVVRFGDGNIEQNKHAENVIDTYIGIPLTKAFGNKPPIQDNPQDTGNP